MCWIVFLVYASIEVTGYLLERGKCGCWTFLLSWIAKCEEQMPVQCTSLHDRISASVKGFVLM